MKYNKLKDEFNINISEELVKKLDFFQELFVEQCSKVNLVSKKDEQLIWEKHIFDSCAIHKIRAFPTFKRLLDIGTGGGFPSLPLAIVNPELKVVALDSIAKKIDVITEIKNKMQLINIEPTCLRSEHLGSKYFEYFDVATSRAVAPLNIILELAAPYIKIGGYFVAYKSQSAQNELEMAQKAMSELGFELSEIIEYKLPLDEEFTRKLVVIKKIAKTPSCYPRNVGQAKSQPL